MIVGTRHSRDLSRACVAKEGSGWWVALPRAFPEPPVEPFEAAKSRAIRLALAAMDPPPYRQPSAIVVARSTAGDDHAAGRLRGGGGSDWRPSPSTNS